MSSGLEVVGSAHEKLAKFSPPNSFICSWQLLLVSGTQYKVWSPEELLQQRTVQPNTNVLTFSAEHTCIPRNAWWTERCHSTAGCGASHGVTFPTEVGKESGPVVQTGPAGSEVKTASSFTETTTSSITSHSFKNDCSSNKQHANVSMTASIMLIVWGFLNIMIKHYTYLLIYTYILQNSVKIAAMTIYGEICFILPIFYFISS